MESFCAGSFMASKAKNFSLSVFSLLFLLNLVDKPVLTLMKTSKRSSELVSGMLVKRIIKYSRSKILCCELLGAIVPKELAIPQNNQNTKSLVTNAN